MPIPTPAVPLDGVCSVIFNNTLYTYSADAFQALPLSPGAKWKKLSQGEKVTGGVCVGSTPADSQLAGFYVVGGKGATDGYQGLQKYTYSTGKWQTISPETAVTQDRLWHGAVYLNSSDSILLYAGSQSGDKYLSSQTFTIGASPPYAVAAYESAAPPAINPILLPWSYTQAVMIGGSPTNTQVKLFSPETSWVDAGATLAAPLEKDRSAMKAVIVTGDDGSKSLYIFDMTVSPNVVKRILLVDGQGTTIHDAAPVAKNQAAGESAEVERRATDRLTADDWPEYDPKLAPTATRTNYAAAEDENGLVVFAGGNSDDILCMFNARENSWQNATALLVDQSVFAADRISSSSQSATATPTPTTLSTSSSDISAVTTPTATPSTTPAAAAVAGSDTSGLPSNAVLGISLGSIFGLALILAILYCCLERRRKKRASLEAGNEARGDAASSEKDSIAFVPDSLPRGPVKGGFRGHQPQDSQSSFSSMAILMGRIKQQPQQTQQTGGISRNSSHQTKRSSTSSIFNKAFKSTISKPIPQATQTAAAVPAAQSAEIHTGDDKGVTFAPNSTAPRPRAANAAAAIDRQGSTRRSSGWNRYWSGGSALNILGFGNGNGSSATGANSRVTANSDRSSNYSERSRYRITQDSATVPPLNVYEPRASFSRVHTGSPTIAHNNSRLTEGMSGQIERPVSAVSDGSAYSSGIPASVHDAWDPTDPAKPWGTDRAPSSAYSSGCATALAPAGAASKQSAAPPTGVSRQPQLAMASSSSDMSWLNLGEQGSFRL